MALSRINFYRKMAIKKFLYSKLRRCVQFESWMNLHIVISKIQVHVSKGSLSIRQIKANDEKWHWTRQFFSFPYSIENFVGALMFFSGLHLYIPNLKILEIHRRRNLVTSHFRQL